jgi:FkbM family methyltransferase
MKRFGTNYGGFYYPNDLDGLNKDSILYCVGAGEDIMHDIEIANQIGSDVYIFDPTPRAITHVNYIKDLFDGNVEKIPSRKYGGGDKTYLDILETNKINSEKIKLMSYGLYTEDAIKKFYKPTNVAHVSHSIVEGMKGLNYIDVEVKTLNTIMKDLGHNRIDLLKIDIEGCECDVIEKMIADNIYPKYLSVDFDLGWHGERIQDRGRCDDIVRLLLKNNYILLHKTGSDCSFKLNI